MRSLVVIWMETSTSSAGIRISFLQMMWNLLHTKVKWPFFLWTNLKFLFQNKNVLQVKMIGLFVSFSYFGEKLQLDYNYSGQSAKPQDKITEEDLAKYFANYDRRKVGQLDHLFNKWADAKGINSKYCKLIASIFNIAIDSAKTGMSRYIPNSCQTINVLSPNRDTFRTMTIFTIKITLVLSLSNHELRSSWKWQL